MKASAFNLDRPQPGENIVYWDKNQRQHTGILVRYEAKFAVVSHPVKGEVKCGIDDVKRRTP